MPKRMAERRIGARDRMTKLVAGLPTKAAKIRRLGEAGYKRAAIADFLGISYQHVRNVLKQPAPKVERYELPPTTQPTGVSETDNAAAMPDFCMLGGDPPLITLRLRADGSVLLPPEVIEVLMAEPGQYITASFESGELTLLSPDAVIRRAREWDARPVPPDRLWSDQLVIERRREGALENAKLVKWARSS